MTLLGKIFTVLILIMSLVFMAFSVMLLATDQKWKLQAMNPPPGQAGHDAAFEKTGLKFQVQDWQQRASALEDENEALKTQLSKESASRTRALGKMHTLADRAETEKNDAIRIRTAKEAELRDLTDEVKVKVEELTRVTEENKDLRGRIAAVQDESIAKTKTITDLTDKIQALEGTKRKLEEVRNRLASDYAKLKRVANAAGIDENTLAEKTPPPLIGRVSDISQTSKDFVEISLGWDDGLRLGHQLDVYRDRSYLGRIEIRRVGTNRSVAQVVSAKGQIKKDDSVTTKLDG